MPLVSLVGRGAKAYYRRGRRIAKRGSRTARRYASVATDRVLAVPHVDRYARPAISRWGQKHPSLRGTLYLAEAELASGDRDATAIRALVIERAGRPGIVAGYVRLLDTYYPDEADEMAIEPLVAHKAACPQDRSLRPRELRLVERAREGWLTGDPGAPTISLGLARALIRLSDDQRENIRFGGRRVQPFLRQQLGLLVKEGYGAEVAAFMGEGIGHGRTASALELRIAVASASPETAAQALAMIEEVPTEEVTPAFAVWAARRFQKDDELGKALTYAEWAAQAGDAHGQDLARSIRAFIEVLDGTVAPYLDRQPAFEPVPGRILHVVSKSLPFHQSGYTIRTRSIVRAQRSAGLDPHIVVRQSPYFAAGTDHFGDVDATVDLDGTPVHPIRAASTGAPIDVALQAQVEAVGQLVAHIRPSVIHAHSDFTNAMVGRTVARAFGIPYVYEVRGFWEVTRLSRHPRQEPTDRFHLMKQRESLEARSADAVVTLARTMRAELVERGVAEDAIRLVPNAIDPAEVVAKPRDPQRQRQLGLDGAELVVGYVTSLVDYEGVGTLVEAVAHLRAMGRDVRLLVVGDGPVRESLVAHAWRLGLGPAAVFTGRVPHRDVPGLYALLDVFVVPRLDLPVCRLVSPLKPYEAMLLGLPLVVSDLPVLRELNDSGAVETFVADDPASLAKTLLGLLDDPDRRHRNGRRGQEWVLTERTWEGNAARYQALYEDLTTTSSRQREAAEAAEVPGIGGTSG